MWFHQKIPLQKKASVLGCGKIQDLVAKCMHSWCISAASAPCPHHSNHHRLAQMESTQRAARSAPLASGSHLHIIGHLIWWSRLDRSKTSCRKAPPTTLLINATIRPSQGVPRGNHTQNYQLIGAYMPINEALNPEGKLDTCVRSCFLGGTPAFGLRSVCLCVVIFRCHWVILKKHPKIPRLESQRSHDSYDISNM